MFREALLLDVQRPRREGLAVDEDLDRIVARWKPTGVLDVKLRGSVVAIADFLRFLTHDSTRKTPARADRSRAGTVREHRGKHCVIGLEPGRVIADALIRIQRAAGLNRCHAQRSAWPARGSEKAGDDESRCDDQNPCTYQLTSQL